MEALRIGFIITRQGCRSPLAPPLWVILNGLPDLVIHPAFHVFSSLHMIPSSHFACAPFFLLACDSADLTSLAKGP